MLPQPLTRYNEIIEILRSIEKRDARLVFQLKGYKKEAEALSKHDPVQGYSLLGAIACLEHNLSEMHRNHNIAIQQDYSIFTLSNYKASLELSCLWSLAFEYGLKCCDYDPSCPDYIDKTLTVLPLAGQFSKANELLKRWHGLNPAKQHPQESFIQGFENFSKKTGITEPDLIHVLGVLQKTLSESNIYVQSYGYAFPEVADSIYYCCHFFLPEHDEKVHLYENLLDAALSSPDIDCKIKEHVVFNFIDSSINIAVSALEDDIERDKLHQPSPADFALISELIDGVKF